MRIFNVSSDDEIDAAFATIVEQRIGGLIVQADQFFTVRRDQLVLLTTRHAVPTIFGWREFRNGRRKGVYGGESCSTGTTVSELACHSSRWHWTGEEGRSTCSSRPAF